MTKAVDRAETAPWPETNSTRLEDFERAFRAAYENLEILRGPISVDLKRALEAATEPFFKLEHVSWPSFRRVLTRQRYVVDGGGGADRPLTDFGSAIIRCARLALAFAFGRDELIRSDESDLARAAWLLLIAPAPKVPAPSSEMTSVIADGQFTLIETAFASDSQPRANHPRTRLRSSIPIRIDNIDRDRATVAFRLSAPGSGWLEILDVDGELYRPILAPGCWEPITLDRFASAMREGEAWRDSPTADVQRARHGDIIDVADWLDDYAVDQRPATRREATQKAEREGIIRDRCAGLACIGRTVWKRIQEPTLRLVADRPPFRAYTALWNRNISATWIGGTLSGCLDQSTLTRPRCICDVLNPAFEQPRQAFPLSAEPILRSVAAKLTGINTVPIATLGDGSPLPAPTFAELSWVADAFATGLERLDVWGRAPFHADQIQWAASEFLVACESGVPGKVAKAAKKMRKVAWKVGDRAAAENLISKIDAKYVANEHYSDSRVISDAANAAMALADAVAEFALSPARKIEPEDHDDIASAFEPGR